MRAVRVVPCLDVDGGRVVKGVRFEGLRDAGDPVELAARYDEEGADEVVFYDITASAHERQTMLEVVARTSEEVFIPLTVGGGVRSLEDARRLLRLGADKVSVNSAAVARPELVQEISGTFGASAPSSGSTSAAPPGRRRHGRCTPTAAVSLRAWTLWPGPSAANSSGRANWSSIRWTETAPGRATTWSSPAA